MQTQKIVIPVICGLLLLMIAGFGMTSDGGERFKLLTEVVKDLGVVVIGLTLVELVWYLVGGAPSDLALTQIKETSDEIKVTMNSDLDELRSASKDTLAQLRTAIKTISDISLVAKSSGRTGLIDVGESQDNLGYAPTSFVQDIRAAKTSIDVMGVTLNIIYGYDSVLAALLEKADEGVVVRVLLPDPASQHLTAIFDDRFRKEVELGSSSLIQLISSKSSKIKIGILDQKVMSMSFIRVDDIAIMSPYLYSSQSPEAPRIRIRGNDSPLMLIYRKEFDALWKISKSPQADFSRQA